ncbi:hypothetical protein NDU88_006211 [Pleurodeles waltl]|uniref:Uncharacterized protein n=1 Tax=Pleurodeles waltl TaxID=8319 RepID=A0AAV7LNH1_PLEWA|nr:hypothetical protein NDU88_006211 [Pleurodeles waltl]
MRPDRRRGSFWTRAETGTRTQRGAERTGGRGCQSLRAGTEEHPCGPDCRARLAAWPDCDPAEDEEGAAVRDRRGPA